MNSELEKLRAGKLGSEFKLEAAGVSAKSDLDSLHVKWLSKKGIIKTLFAELRNVEPEQRALIAAELNRLKVAVEEFCQGKEQEFERAGLQARLLEEFFDLSLPSQSTGLGQLHPIAKIERKIMSVLEPLGFKAVYGPEIETEYYCFDSLNIPKHHPARDMQDTFYTDTGHVLRTHTTSVQARVLEAGGGRINEPLKVASFGRVYRNETEDASHTSMFHQFELIWIEAGLKFCHLVGLVEHILRALYGAETMVRFVPKFYPYTEPSVGAQIACGLCQGAGCSFCGGAGWSTIAGAGMVHSQVLREFKYEPEKVSGIAFGLGTTRLAAQAFKLPRGKMLYEPDVRTIKSLS